MFDLDRVKVDIAEQFLKRFNNHSKLRLVKRFIRRWLELLHTYSRIPYFVSFDSPAPILNFIVPHPTAVLIVPFENSAKFVIPNVSVFPLYPFRVNLTYKSFCCREGLELLSMYLKITNVPIVGIRGIYNHKKIFKSLKQKFPHLLCYPPALIAFFWRVIKVRNGCIYKKQKTRSMSSEMPLDGSES